MRGSLTWKFTKTKFITCNDNWRRRNVCDHFVGKNYRSNCMTSEWWPINDEPSTPMSSVDCSKNALTCFTRDIHIVYAAAKWPYLVEAFLQCLCKSWSLSLWSLGLYHNYNSPPFSILCACNRKDQKQVQSACHEWLSVLDFNNLLWCFFTA